MADGQAAFRCELLQHRRYVDIAAAQSGRMLTRGDVTNRAAL
jgi:hypothetical protein